MDEKIQARLILEVLGRPPEHVLDALKLLVEKISKENGVTLLEKEIHEPILAKDAKDLYTSFVDITLEFKSVDVFFAVLFAYMPANVEIIYPERITLANDSLTYSSNKLLHNLHNYDAIAKGILAERNIIMQKLKEKAPEVLKELSYYFAPSFQNEPSQKEKTKKQKNLKNSKKRKKSS